MSVTIIVEITNELLRHVSTHEMSSSRSSLVLAKITYECTEMCKLRLISQLAHLSARWRSWLRHWKVAGSIPDGVIGIFH